MSLKDLYTNNHNSKELVSYWDFLVTRYAYEDILNSKIFISLDQTLQCMGEYDVKHTHEQIKELIRKQIHELAKIAREKQPKTKKG